MVDLIILGAKVLTQDPAHPRAQAIAVSGERIVAVGTDEALRPAIGRATRVIEARGALVTPGFNDAHLHFLDGGFVLTILDLREMSDPAAVAARVAEAARATPDGEWILGSGWNQERFPGQAWPTRECLDAVAPRHPVALYRVDGHTLWVNALALEKGGIDRDTPDPSGGRIVRDPRSGEPTGLLQESAVLGVPVPRLEEGEGARLPEAWREQALERALAQARIFGVTSVQHLVGQAELFERFRRQGRLTCRVTFSMPLPEDEAAYRELEALRQRFRRDDPWLRFGFLKGFADGTLGSSTACLFDPWADDPTSSGLAQMPYPELARRILAADRRGFQVGIHAIGDRAVRWVLDACEEAQGQNGPAPRRHRVEHAQLVSDEDFPRFARLGIIASMQPSHCRSDQATALKKLGPARCRNAYAWRKLRGAGAKLAFGTDWPVEPLNPLEGIQAAVTRRGPGERSGDGFFPAERLSREEALSLYTQGSAYAEWMDEHKGSVVPGMLADLVIWERDLLQVPADEIDRVRANCTLVGGRIVHEI